MRLLDAGGRELPHDHAREVPLRTVVGLPFRHAVQKLVVLVDRQHAVRRQALDRERPRHPDLPLVLVGLVVEVLVVRLGSYRVVDLLLPGDPRLPPQSMRLRDLRGPRLGRLARNLPFFPVAIEPRVQVLAQRLQRLLPALPDDVELGVVGDGLQGDVRNAFVDEPLSDIASRGALRRDGVGDLRLFALALWTVGKQVVRVTSPHDAGTREGQGDTGGVDGDPAATPLLRDVGCGARATSRIKHEVAWVRGHQDASLNDIGISLNNIHRVRLAKKSVPEISYCREATLV